MKKDYRYTITFVMTMGFFFGCFLNFSYAQPLKAHATVYDSQGKEVGMVMFEEVEAGVSVHVMLYDFVPGVHGFHIHETGKCEPPDFVSAGGHFNPLKAKHGFLNPNGPHAGDLPNIVAAQDGTCDTTFVTGRVTLKKGKSSSLFGANGTSIMIHEMPDDYIADPAGMAGKRIACGVIEEMTQGHE